MEAEGVLVVEIGLVDEVREMEIEFTDGEAGDGGGIAGWVERGHWRVILRTL